MIQIGIKRHALAYMERGYRQSGLTQVGEREGQRKWGMEKGGNREKEKRWRGISVSKMDITVERNDETSLAC